MMANSAKSSRVINATPFFYGWVILVVGTVGIIMMGPSQTFTLSVFIDYFIKDLGISRANISLIYGLATFSASLLLPRVGRLVDRYGTRRTTPIVVLLLGLASLAMAVVQGPITIFFGFLALRFLGFGSLQLVSNYTIAQWFIRRRGQVMGLAGLSLSIGLLIFPGLSQYLISHIGWRLTFVLLGVLVWAVMLPIGWGFFRERPELYGLRPDGDSLPLPSHTEVEPSALEENWTLAEARRTSIFWLFSAGITVLTMILAGLVFHQTSLFEARGLDRAVAVNAFNVIAIFSVLGNLATGWLLDHTSPRWVLAGSLFLLAVSMVMILVMHTPQQALVFGAINGVTGGAFRVLDAVVWAKYFGRLHLGSIRGAVMIGVVGGTALGPYPLGLSLDYLGSYTPVMLGLLVLPLGIGLAALLIKRPVKRVTLN